MMPVIQLEEVHKTYETGEVQVRALRGVSLTITRGELVAVMGASGSGKSTLMNVLGCLDQATQGQYRLDGTPVAELDRDELALLRNRKLGFVFQSFNLLARTTALENVELPLFYGPARPSREMRERAAHCLELVGLADRMEHYPSQLSGGQQQRVAIARALVNAPEVIFADEPTGNLDTKTSIEVMGLFQRLNEQGITLVMVTHELDIARYCRRTLVMRDGRLVSDAPVTARLQASEEMKRVLAEEAAAQLTA